MLTPKSAPILPSNSNSCKPENGSLHLITQALQEYIRPSTTCTSTFTRLMVDSFIPSMLSYLACTTMDTSPSFSILLFPFLQLGVSKISTHLKNMLTTTTTILGMTHPPPPPPETVEQLTILVKQLVMDQHRTMFYTVTLSTTPPLPTYIPRRHTENLKVAQVVVMGWFYLFPFQWQYATSVCKSQAVIKRSNTNCPTYYSITFMGEIMDEEEEP